MKEKKKKIKLSKEEKQAKRNEVFAKAFYDTMKAFGFENMLKSMAGAVSESAPDENEVKGENVDVP